MTSLIFSRNQSDPAPVTIYVDFHHFNAILLALTWLGSSKKCVDIYQRACMYLFEPNIMGIHQEISVFLDITIRAFRSKGHCRWTFKSAGEAWPRNIIWGHRANWPINVPQACETLLYCAGEPTAPQKWLENHFSLNLIIFNCLALLK